MKVRDIKLNNMKKVILGVVCAVMSLMSASAQAIREDEMALVYYMPQTQMVVDVEYETVVLHRGIYADYAKQYLGSVEVVKDDDMWYNLTNITTRMKSAADMSRAFKVSDNPLLVLSCKGTLLGYNIEREKKECGQGCHRHDDKKAKPEENKVKVLPLLEEHIVGKSLEEQAHGAAKLIYRIRENRLYLIGGEVDKVPADGEAMKLALDKMDEMERELVELFIGRVEIKKYHKSFTYTPLKTDETDLAYFSEKEGFTTAENGEPITLSLTAHRQSKGYANTDPKKKATVASQLYYNLPGSADYRITFQKEVKAEGTIPVAQFGVAIPLAQDLLSGKEQPRIRFNPQTGNIESIEK